MLLSFAVGGRGEGGVVFSSDCLLACILITHLPVPTVEEIGSLAKTFICNLHHRPDFRKDHTYIIPERWPILLSQKKSIQGSTTSVPGRHPLLFFLSVLSDHQGHTRSAVCQPPALPNGWQTASQSTGYQWWVKEEQEIVSHLILNLSWPHSSSRLKCSSLETQVYLFCPPMSCSYYFPLCLVHICLHQSFLFSGINVKSPLHCLRTHALKHDF